jgi:hypothetical protein
VVAERLQDVEDWDDAAWCDLTARDLVLRLERWATLEVWPDRSKPVLERMGVRVWPAYAPTGGALVPDRATWDAWEALVDGWETLSLEDAFAALAWPVWPPGRLDLRRLLSRRVRELAREAERAGDYTDAAAWLDRLVELEGAPAWKVAVRRARVAELAGELDEALGILEAGRALAPPDEAFAISRAGRRVAARRRLSWAPDPPLGAPRTRDLALRLTSREGQRPRWEDGVFVEAAVAAHLEAHGRRVLRGEAPVFRTLVALLLSDALLLPVAGQLPVSHLRGPLDAWTPAFAARRPVAVWELWDAVVAGQGPGWVADAGEAYLGVQLTGVRAGIDVDDLVTLAEGLGPAGLLALLEPVLAWGRRAFGGLPDLVVLPGDEVRVDGAWPGRLGAGLHLVEVKGPGDSLREGQRVWLDRFTRAGVAAEVWQVTPAG